MAINEHQKWKKEWRSACNYCKKFHSIMTFFRNELNILLNDVRSAKNRTNEGEASKWTSPSEITRNVMKLRWKPKSEVLFSNKKKKQRKQIHSQILNPFWWVRTADSADVMHADIMLSLWFKHCDMIRHLQIRLHFSIIRFAFFVLCHWYNVYSDERIPIILAENNMKPEIWRSKKICRSSMCSLREVKPYTS